MDSAPLPADAREHLIAPFLEAVAIVLRDTTATEAFPLLGDPALSACDLMATLELTSAVEGALVLGFPTATAWALARRFLAGVTDPDEGLMRDCLGELANVIAGQAKAMAHGTAYAFLIGTPTVRAADPGFPLTGDPLTVALDSDAGPFVLQLTLRPDSVSPQC